MLKTKCINKDGNEFELKLIAYIGTNDVVIEVENTDDLNRFEQDEVFDIEFITKTMFQNVVLFTVEVQVNDLNLNIVNIKK